MGQLIRPMDSSEAHPCHNSNNFASLANVTVMPDEFLFHVLYILLSFEAFNATNK